MHKIARSNISKHDVRVRIRVRILESLCATQSTATERADNACVQVIDLDREPLVGPVCVCVCVCMCVCLYVCFVRVIVCVKE